MSSSICQPPAPALVVVSGGGACPDWPDAQARPFDPLLAQALPRAARVLEVGPGAPQLARRYKQAHPGAHWTCIALGDTPATHADGVDVALKWGRALPQGTQPFDLLIVNGVLGLLPDAAATLRLLSEHAAPDACLWLDADNHASLRQLARWLDGDVGGQWRQQALPGQPQLHGPASLYRLLMDAGWMPHLARAATGLGEPLPNQQALNAWLQRLDLDSLSARPTRSVDRLLIEARRVFKAPPAASRRVRFDVVVPTTDERQLRVNVEQSPGLREVDARIVSCRGAATPADAWTLAQPHLTADWVLMCHQDVYFPAGFGAHLEALLAEVDPAERSRSLIGFMGLAAGPGGKGATPAGFIIDRLHRADHPASSQAVSIDEVALVMARDTVHRIDPTLGWHLWATDLCLQAICNHGAFPRIVRAPLFHNSRTGWKLPDAFAASAHRLRAKWGADFGPIHTLCGTIDADFLARQAPAP